MNKVRSDLDERKGLKEMETAMKKMMIAAGVVRHCSLCRGE